MNTFIIENFNEMINFLTDRMNYYVDIKKELPVWEVQVKLKNDTAWIRKIDENLFDVMLESEQNKYRITYLMDKDELQEFLLDVSPCKYICGKIYSGN